MLKVVGIGQSHYADYDKAVSSPDIEIEQVTPNVYTFTGIRGCDPSMVMTSEGAVFIDTAQWITQLEQMIAFAKEKCGGVKYLINTESHIDHVFGNPYLKKAGATIIAHEKVLDSYYKIPPAFNMTTYEYNLDLLKRQDPTQTAKLLPEGEEEIGKPDITFSDRMTLKVGDHTFEIFHTPGHSPEQASVYCPEERVVFVGDNIFNNCQIWFHSIDFDALFKSLDWLQSLDVDYIIPGHGPIKGKECIAENKQFIYEWLSVVGDAIINKGWTRQECIDRINFADRCPVDIGQQDCMEYISTNNARIAYDYIVRKGGL
ncbi:MBL fold metallo-hydrolase [Dysosmobacter sp.]|uniref:MBL fold metallo-hydrolase n=1 Tax=Dysosmobacter sp. TaxID=2591382 RepID=UPI003AB8E2F0